MCQAIPLPFPELSQSHRNRCSSGWLMLLSGCQWQRVTSVRTTRRDRDKRSMYYFREGSFSGTCRIAHVLAGDGLHCWFAECVVIRVRCNTLFLAPFSCKGSSKFLSTINHLGKRQTKWTKWKVLRTDNMQIQRDCALFRREDCWRVLEPLGLLTFLTSTSQTVVAGRKEESGERQSKWVANR